MLPRFFLIFFVFFSLNIFGSHRSESELFSSDGKAGTFYFGLDIQKVHLQKTNRPHPLLLKFRIKPNNTKKYVAAALAFPFPFGIVGLHRIYLGCQPYVPVAYIGTVGGGFGVLPFIDFCAILSHKNIDTYVNNKKVFMWIN